MAKLYPVGFLEKLQGMGARYGQQRRFLLEPSATGEGCTATADEKELDLVHVHFKAGDQVWSAADEAQTVSLVTSCVVMGEILQSL